tara:strand:- start:274 stop:621 length:348 start_codon:yes stop_codon:yes gene_type:complete
MKTLPQSMFWGLLPGFLTAFGGAYKDTLFEPFEPLKFFRSPIVSFIWYIIIDHFYKKQSVILKIGLCSMMERLSVETYKAIYRPEPGKFKNCTCNNGECQLIKDRGWFLDRLKGK